jgi:hypothetical protein
MKKYHKILSQLNERKIFVSPKFYDKEMPLGEGIRQGERGDLQSHTAQALVKLPARRPHRSSQEASFRGSRVRQKDEVSIQGTRNKGRLRPSVLTFRLQNCETDFD